MRIGNGAVLVATAILALLTHSLPIYPLDVDNARIEQRRTPYSVVPVHGDSETSTVTVPGVPPPPVTRTITATVTMSDSEPTVVTSTITSPASSIVASQMTSTTSTTSTTSSAIQASSTSTGAAPPGGPTTHFRPSMGFHTPSASPTSMTYHPPTLLPATGTF